MKKAFNIMVLSILSIVLLFGTTMAVWSSLDKTSPVVIIQGWFGISPEAVDTADGVNLFNAESGVVFDALDGVIYDEIEIADDTNYCISVTLEEVNDMPFLIFFFSDIHIAELEDTYDFESIANGGDKDIDLVVSMAFNTKFVFNKNQYNRKFLTILSPGDCIEDWKIKVEIGTNPTPYSLFGLSEPFVFVPEVEELAVEPTALVISEEINALYLNTSESATNILNDLIPDSDAGTNICFSQTLGTDGDWALTLMVIEGFEDKMLALFGPDDSIILLWVSSLDNADFVAFLSDAEISATQAGFQTDVGTNLLELMNLESTFINRIGNSTTDANYEMWETKANFDTLFSSTPFPQQ